MEKITSGTIELTWDSGLRLAMIRFERATSASGADANVLVGAMERWIGRGAEPFALLGDGAELTAVDAEYRAAWSRFFRAHRDHAFIAFYNMGLIIRIAADMFRIGTGVKMRAFSDEDAAREWLRAMGIGA